ncbi:response regulator [Deltaproteobacteria bacterium TL4]
MAKILILDDEKRVAEEVTIYLDEFGYSSTFILSPKVLFRMLEQEPFSLILMDINMPGIDGITLLKQLKTHPEFYKIPVIMLTGDTNEQVFSNCFEMGAIDYVTKPLSKLILKARIKSALMIKTTEEELERRVEQRTQELKNATEQMIQSEKLSAIGELSAGVAHEMKQPLNVIKILSQSLLIDISENRLDKEELKEDLKQVVNQVDKMAQIIDHMRVFSRRTTIGDEKVNVQVNNVIESALKFVSLQLKVNVELVKELNDSLPEVSGNSIQLEQVLMNLLTNARNAVETSGNQNTQIKVRSYEIPRQTSPLNKDAVGIEVSDTGGGIPPHLEDKIFEQFFTTKPPGEGTGLGLSISKKIVHDHQGLIELENRVGEGATFRVILPVGQNSSG